MSERRASESLKNALLAVCALALVGNLFFMFRLDVKQDRYLEYGMDREAILQNKRAIQNLWTNEQTLQAYVGSARNYWRQILSLEEDERMRQVLQSMLDEQLALIAPEGVPNE